MFESQVSNEEPRVSACIKSHIILYSAIIHVPLWYYFCFTSSSPVIGLLITVSSNFTGETDMEILYTLITVKPQNQLK